MTDSSSRGGDEGGPAARVRCHREQHCHATWWADCGGCGWAGDARPDHASARADALDHLAVVHGIGSGTLRMTARDD